MIAVGAGTLNDRGELRPLDVKAGDRVLFGKRSGTEVRFGGEELLIMKESDVMGILEGAAAKRRSSNCSGVKRDGRHSLPLIATTHDMAGPWDVTLLP